MSIILLLTPVIIGVLAYSTLYIINREIVVAKVKQALSDAPGSSQVKMPDAPTVELVAWVTAFLVIGSMVIGLMQYHNIQNERKHERIVAGNQLDVELLKDEIIKILQTP